MRAISLKEEIFMFKKIAVHDFLFHADEVVAVAAISVLYGTPEEVVRIPSRSKETHASYAEQGYTLVDIGEGQFDHHGKAHDWQYNNGVYLSALGKVLKQAVKDGKLKQEELDILLFNGLYALQAKDNGQDFDGVPSPFGFIHWLNGPDPADDHDQEWRFKDAVKMAKRVFAAMLRDAKEAIYEHTECVEAFKAMGEDGIADFPHHMSHGVLECQIWNASHPEKEVKFFTFDNGRGSFMVQGVNKVGSFALNHELPFKGLRDAELNTAAGIDDGVFVHANGFIGGADSLESCHKLAAQAD
jgi:uncharacterized UPF0160 family protein